MTADIGRNVLHQQLTTLFNLEELRTLVFGLDVDADEIAGDTRDVYARELISFFERRKQLPMLVAAVQRERADSLEGFGEEQLRVAAEVQASAVRLELAQAPDEPGQAGGKIHFGVITIREDEYLAVLDLLPDADIVDGRGDRRYRVAQIASRDGRPISVAVARSVEQGTGEAQQLASELIRDLDPQWILVVGIAGGFPDSEFSLGDVVISSYVHNLTLEAAKEGGGREFSIKGGQMHGLARRVVADLPVMLRRELGDWQQHVKLERPDLDIDDLGDRVYGDDEWRRKVSNSVRHHFAEKRQPIAVTGEVASSDRLLKNTAIAASWSQVARHIMAVEMESAGVYRAVSDRPFLAIRGISDIVGLHREGAWTEYACVSAAALALALMQSGLMPMADDPYRPPSAPPVRSELEDTPPPVTPAEPVAAPADPPPRARRREKVLMNRKSEVRLYRRMLNQEVRERILLIEGAPKMGKSRLLREFRWIARHEKRIPCALVDIRTRGRSFRDVLQLIGREINYPLRRYEELARQLSRAAAPGAGVTPDALFQVVQQHGDRTGLDQQQRLTQAFVEDLTIVSAQTQVALILDAFEEANELTRQWIADELLIGLYRLPNLVTIIAGRRLPPLETTWEDYAIVNTLTKVDIEDFRDYRNQIGAQDITDEQIPMLYQGFTGNPGSFAEFADNFVPPEE